MAEQAGAGARRTAAPPVVPYNLTPEDHFAAALRVQIEGGPLDFPSPVDVDIAYVANLMADLGQEVTGFRQYALDCFLGLCARLEGVTRYIRASQTSVLAAVNPKVHFAVIALLIAMMQWPDTSFCAGLHSGFPAVGYLPPCGIWASQAAEFASLQDVLCEGPSEAPALIAGLSDKELEVVHDLDSKMSATTGVLRSLAGRNCKGVFPSTGCCGDSSSRKLLVRSESLMTQQVGGRVFGVALTGFSFAVPCSLAHTFKPWHKPVLIKAWRSCHCQRFPVKKISQMHTAKFPCWKSTAVPAS